LSSSAPNNLKSVLISESNLFLSFLKAIVFYVGASSLSLPSFGSNEYLINKNKSITYK